MKKIYLILTFALFCKLLSAQLVVNSSYTTNQLVQNVLLGSGVTASNITYNGVSKAIGYFNGVNSNIGLDSGIVLTSGDIKNAVGPNNSGSKTTSNGLAGDADLTALCGSQTYDQSVLEFDFVPTADKISFRYVFGSEEYHEYVNSINDVFAFFISGPGINGVENIALIPGTNTYVSINNVNKNKNNTYFFDNESPKGQTIEYDGFTTVLEAIADSLIPGQTYHIKIAIADAVDKSWDSGVFLEAGSFKGNVASTLTILPPGNDTTLFEGCGQAKLTFVKSVLASDTVYLSYSGSALNGIDNSTLPDTLIFSNSDTIVLYFDALVDTVTEGPEDLYIDVTSISGTDTITIQLTTTINDIVPLTIASSNDTTMLCPNSISLETFVQGGTGNYHYTWNTADTTSLIYVSPNASTTYYVTVSDTCGVSPISDTVNVIIPYADTLKVNILSDTSMFCPSPVTLEAVATGGKGNHTFSWSIISSTDSIVTVNPLVTTTYIVTVKDVCGDQTTDAVTITLPSISPLTASISNDTSLYCPSAVTLVSQGAGGYGNYSYEWNTTETTSSVTVEPATTTQYIVTITDSCKLDSVVKKVTVTMPTISPLSLLLPNDTNLCKGESMFISPIVGGGQKEYTYLWNNTSYDGNTVEVTADSIHTITISVTDSCGTTVSETVQVTALTFVASFIATPISENNISFNSSITNGGTVLEWNFGDGNTSTEQNPSHIYAQEGTYNVTVVVQNSIGCLDTLYSTVIVYEEFNLGNTFTPNGDGINDYFEIPNSGLGEFEIKVYNRWGRLLFETTDTTKHWDGKTKTGAEASAGTYFYVIKAISPFNDYSGSGIITLIRE